MCACTRMLLCRYERSVRNAALAVAQAVRNHSWGRNDTQVPCPCAQSRTVSDQLLCLTLSLVSLTALTVAPLRCQTYARACCVRTLC